MTDPPSKQELIEKLEDTNRKLGDIQDKMNTLMEELVNVFYEFSNTLSPVINDYYKEDEE